MIELLGDALVATADRVRKKLEPTVKIAAAWVRDAAEPPRGVRLVADDGSTYTGLAIFERSKPVVMLAFKHDTTTAQRPPVVTPAASPPRPDPYDYRRTGVYERRSSWEDEESIPFR